MGVRFDARRAGRATIVLGTIGAVACTLWPFAFAPSSDAIAENWSRVEWVVLYEHGGRVTIDRDLLQNLVLLAPIGAGWALVRRGRRGLRVTAEALLLGLALSVLLEAAQLLTPDRVSQLADVWRNATGCAAGAAVAAFTRARASER